MAQVQETFLFTPTTVPGCQLWLDAADPNGTGTKPANGSSISQWKDKSVNNVALTTTGSPTYSSAQSAIVFAGTSYFQNTTFSLNLGSRSIFLVANGTGTNEGILALTYTTVDYNNLNALVYVDNGSRNIFLTENYPTFNAGFTSPVSPVLVSDTLTNTALSYFGNGSLVATATIAATASTGIIIGGRNDQGGVLVNKLLNGTINEVILFSPALPTLQRQQIEGYLAWKWGLQVNLPSTHPFKTYRPLAQTPFPVVGIPPIPMTVRGIPPFAPTQISGCSLWLDAADTTTLTLSGSTATQWNDKSGSGYNCTVTPGANAPTYSTSLKAIQCRAASTQSFDIPQAYGNFLVGKSYSIFFVGTRLASGYQYFLSGSALTLNQTLQLGYTGNDTTSVEFSLYGNSIYATVPDYSASDPARILGFTSSVSPAQREVIVDGTIGVTSAVAGTLTAFLDPRIGRRYNSPFITYHSIDVYEMITYSSSLPVSQRQQVEGYLAWKWGLQANLPPNHPYKNQALQPFTLTLPVRGSLNRWQPTQISGCQLWLDAADAKTLSLSGTTVTQWNDKSGNGKNATVAAGTLSYSSQTRSIAFNGSSYFSLPTNTFLTGNSNYAMFIISSSTLANYYWILAGGPAFAPGQCIGCVYYPNGVIENGWWSTNIQTAPGAVQANTVAMLECIYTSPSLTTVINGTPRASSSTLGARNGQASPNYIGTRADSSPTSIQQALVGNIYEIVVLGTTTPAQQQQMEGYLAWKWGLVGSLPATHPFKLFPPPP